MMRHCDEHKLNRDIIFFNKRKHITNLKRDKLASDATVDDELLDVGKSSAAKVDDDDPLCVCCYCCCCCFKTI